MKPCTVVRGLALVGLVAGVVASCGVTGGGNDLAVAPTPDLGLPDLSAVPDQALAADLATAPDLSGAVDMLAVVDQAVPADLTMPPDLTHPPDLTSVADLASTAVTYSNTAKAIFEAKCSPCHSTMGYGGHNIAVSYADTQLASTACAGKTKGECALIRIKNGSMPQGQGCTGNPVTDAGNAACTTAAQQAALQAWIDGGQLP